jgi:hypothetical protein
MVFRRTILKVLCLTPPYLRTAVAVEQPRCQHRGQPALVDQRVQVLGLGDVPVPDLAVDT